MNHLGFKTFLFCLNFCVLNRIKLNAIVTNIDYATNIWDATGSGINNNDPFLSEYEYDAMGNITHQKRNGKDMGQNNELDDLDYNYHTNSQGLINNRLYGVNDIINTTYYTDDIDDQGIFDNTHSTIETANNYGYDPMGNLIRDNAEGIANIEWTVYGKIKKITRAPGHNAADLEFGYDASGNRLWKKVIPKGSNAIVKTFYYIRDASGNEMSRYQEYSTQAGDQYYIAEGHAIYGSARVGLDNRRDTLYKNGIYAPAWFSNNYHIRDLGLKSYELSNHLGNVLVTVSDKKVYKFNGANIEFEAEITSINDYYPFGSPIKNRTFSSGTYRYGFQGQEKDNEVAGTGNSYTAEYWQYDSRLGRRFNVDPVDKEYESSYASFSNNPLYFIDPDGDDGIPNNITGVMGATFIFVPGPGITMAQVSAYQLRFMGNLNSFFDGSRSYTNSIGIETNIAGRFSVGGISSSVPTGTIPKGTNYIVVNPDNGQRSNADFRGNVARMNINDGGNSETHEVLHLFGLTDRYNFEQKVETNPRTIRRNGDNIYAGINLVPMSLSEAQDPEYFGNENQNIMANSNSNAVTQMQWSVVFNDGAEMNYGPTTFFTGSRTNILGPVRVINGQAMTWTKSPNGNDFMTPNAAINRWFQIDPTVGPSNNLGTTTYNRSTNISGNNSNYQAP